MKNNWIEFLILTHLLPMNSSVLNTLVRPNHKKTKLKEILKTIGAYLS